MNYCHTGIYYIPFLYLIYTAICDMPECRHGDCTEPDVCDCHDGWDGAACDIREE